MAAEKSVTMVAAAAQWAASSATWSTPGHGQGGGGSGMVAAAAPVLDGRNLENAACMTLLMICTTFQVR